MGLRGREDFQQSCCPKECGRAIVFSYPSKMEVGVGREHVRDSEDTEDAS